MMEISEHNRDDMILEKLNDIARRVGILEKQGLGRFRDNKNEYFHKANRKEYYDMKNGGNLIFKRRLAPAPRPWHSTNTGAREHSDNTEPERSSNPQFGELVNNINDSIRTTHQIGAWQSLPKTLEKKIDLFIKNIHLPRKSEKLEERLTQLGNEFKSNLVLMVQDHLMETRDTLSHSRNNLNKVDLNWACNKAVERSVKLNKYLSPNVVWEWISEEMERDGRNNGNMQVNQDTMVNNLSSNNDLEEEAEIQEVTEDPPNEATVQKTGDTNRKRAAASPPSGQGADHTDQVSTELVQDTGKTEGRDKKMRLDTIGVVNQKGVRCGDITVNPGNTNEKSDTNDLEGTDWTNDIPETVSFTVDGLPLPTGPLPHTPIPRRMSVSQHLINKPIIYDDTWRRGGTINMKRPVPNLVVADSNFRYANNLPHNCEVHVFPGLNLEQCGKLLQRSHLNKRTSLSTIITNVGINNRRCSPTTNNVDLGKLKTQLLNTGKEHFFNSVSIPDTLSQQEIENLLSLNHAATRKFEDKVIPPVTKVKVMPTDKYKIHYDNDTIDMVCQNIITKVFRDTQSRKTQSQY